MHTESFLLNRLHQQPESEQIQILLRALDVLAENSRRDKAESLALAMGLPLFPKVQHIEAIEGYQLLLQFAHGERLGVDFRRLLRPEHRLERQLLDDEALFRQVEIIDGILAWPHLSLSNDSGGAPADYYDVDSGLVYEAAWESGEPVPPE